MRENTTQGAEGHTSGLLSGDGTILVTIPGQPISQPRPKVSVSARGEGRGYYPERSPRSKRMSYVDYKEYVGFTVRAALGSSYKGPDKRRYRVEVVFYLGGNIRHDGGKLAETIYDALQGLIWENDEQIDEWQGRKVQNADDPRVELKIEVLE